MPTAISEETQNTIDAAEPDFQPEQPFPDSSPERPARRSHKKRGSYRKTPKVQSGGSPEPEIRPPAAAAEPIETPKTLVRGCRWILRNVVTMMQDAYGWEQPEDYEEWLVEASQFGAESIQKHFPDWMDRWGSEILLLAMLLIWVTPNVSRKLRERKKPHIGDGGPEGQRQDNTTLSVAQSA